MAWIKSWGSGNAVEMYDKGFFCMTINRLGPVVNMSLKIIDFAMHGLLKPQVFGDTRHYCTVGVFVFQSDNTLAQILIVFIQKQTCYIGLSFYFKRYGALRVMFGLKLQGMLIDCSMVKLSYLFSYKVIVNGLLSGKWFVCLDAHQFSYNGNHQIYLNLYLLFCQFWQNSVGGGACMEELKGEIE